MSILKRIKDIFRANANSVLDDIENSEKMLDQYVYDMQSEYEKAVEAVAEVIATKNLIEKKHSEMGLKIKDLNKKINLLAEKGTKESDDLATQAIIQRKAYEVEYNQIGIQVQEAESRVTELKNVITQLKSKIEEAKLKKEGLKAKMNISKAQEKVNSIMNGIGANSIKQDFDRIGEKIDKKYETEMAKSELASSSLDSKIDNLEKETREKDAEDELAKIKAKINSKKNEN